MCDYLDCDGYMLGRFIPILLISASQVDIAVNAIILVNAKAKVLQMQKNILQLQQKFLQMQKKILQLQKNMP